MNQYPVTEKENINSRSSLEEAFLFSESKRYDVKGKSYFDSPNKYYCEDIGLRNARIGFRQQEMTNKLTLAEQEELFAKDCKLINLKYEYSGYTGDERCAIITELSVKELWEKYPLIIGRYSPFVHLSIAQGKVIDDANRNEDKYAKRSSRTLDCYGYNDEMSSQLHKKLAVMFDDPFERSEEERLELEREELHQCEIRKARIALSMLQPLQRERQIFYKERKGGQECLIAV